MALNCNHTILFSGVYTVLSLQYKKQQQQEQQNKGEKNSSEKLSIRRKGTSKANDEMN